MEAGGGYFHHLLCGYDGLPHIAEGNRGEVKDAQLSSQSRHRHREITWNGEYVSCTTLITREIPLHLSLS